MLQSEYYPTELAGPGSPRVLIDWKFLTKINFAIGRGQLASEVEGSLHKIVSSGDLNSNPAKGRQEFFACISI